MSIVSSIIQLPLNLINTVNIVIIHILLVCFYTFQSIGDEVYTDGNLQMFEVDGNKEVLYCQNLCLLTKFFIEHKTIYYDTYPFYFYILCEKDEQGSHIVREMNVMIGRLDTSQKTRILKKDTILPVFAVCPSFNEQDMVNS